MVMLHAVPPVLSLCEPFISHAIQLSDVTTENIFFDWTRLTGRERNPGDKRRISLTFRDQISVCLNDETLFPSFPENDRYRP